jgi:hypothetical protein
MAPTDGLVGVILAVLALGFASHGYPRVGACTTACRVLRSSKRCGAGGLTGEEKGIIMTAIETLVLVIVAGLAFITAASLIVIIIGIHQEERHWTLTHGAAPTGVAALSRRVLGAHCDSRFDGLWVEVVDQGARDADSLAAPR